MKLCDFSYDLPKELIAQDPLLKRSDSRLMVLDRKTGEISHKKFTDVLCYLSPGDCLVLNNTKVIPARLYGRKKGSGGKIEILLLKRKDKDSFECLVKPGKNGRKGQEIVFSNELSGVIEDVLSDGNRIIRFSYDGIFEEILLTLGEMPLPPYITHKLKDKDRYQTVYAKLSGSAAAPTAGLHFTKELLDEARNRGIRIAEITLHVGLSTFRPVKEENIEDHLMHTEYFEINEKASDLINKAKDENKRVIAVGTTSTRTLEAAAALNKDKKIRETSGETDIFIYPGYKFNVIDGLITNFHLPESTLLMLVSAFYDRKKILEAYECAVKEKYRFFSFGDAMMII